MRSFVNHTGALLAGKEGQPISAFTAFCREKTLETKPVGGKPAAHQRRRRRAGTRNRNHLTARQPRGSDQILPRVTNPRQPCITDQRNAAALFQFQQQLGNPRAGVVLMKRATSSC